MTWSVLASAALWLGLSALPAQQESRRKLNFYPSLHLKFVSGESENYFVTRTSVVNMSGEPMKDVVMRQKFPKKFTPSLLGDEFHSLIDRPEGWKEKIEKGTYVLELPELRIAEATVLAVELTYRGRPSEMTFPGVEVAYTLDGQRFEEKGPDLTWDLSRYTRYSGTLEDYIERYADVEIEIPEGDDWGFTDLADRVTGRIATGPVEVETSRGGRMRFSIQAGTPGDLRRLILIRRPYNPSKKLEANHEVRRFILGTVSSLADFTLDADAMSIRKGKIAGYDAWIADTRWHDRVKDRLGEGPIRWYIFTDEDEDSLFVVSISAQGRGAGPGKADSPDESREQELMSELTEMVESLRIR